MGELEKSYNVIAALAGETALTVNQVSLLERIA